MKGRCVKCTGLKVKSDHALVPPTPNIEHVDVCRRYERYERDEEVNRKVECRMMSVKDMKLSCKLSLA